jgi:hypothetical protein
VPTGDIAPQQALVSADVFRGLVNFRHGEAKTDFEYDALIAECGGLPV